VCPLTMLINHFIHMMLRSFDVVVHGRILPTGTSHPCPAFRFFPYSLLQLQIQRSPSIKPSKITKIFLTHAHGDHTFGLPGLLCLMGQDKDRSASVAADSSSSSTRDTSSSSGGADTSGQQGPRIVDIYGPQGLRMWLRVAIRYSVSRIVPPYRVHELMDIPMAPEWEYNGRTRRFYYSNNSNGQRTRSSSPQSHSQPPNPTSSPTSYSSSSWQIPRQLVGQRDAVSWIAQAPMISLDPSPLYGEVDGGRDIYPVFDHPLSHEGAPVYEVEDEGDGEIKVYAAPMSHGIPCVGYVVEESAQPGRLRHEHVEPIVRRNVDALKKAGFAVPMKAMAVLKNMDPGTAFTFPDGTVVSYEEAVEPPRPGRKVVICGDTCDSRALSTLAEGADVVVHEATNTYLSGVDKRQEDSGSANGLASFAQQMRTVTRDAMIHGHSTPFMAGSFARSIGAHRLVLNHFSPRYKGDASLDSMSIMLRIERQAMKGSGLNETHVAAAWDLMVLPLPRR
jgi:ribonuclease Z